MDRWLDGRAIREIALELFALIPKRAPVDHGHPGALSPLALWQYVQLWVRVWDFGLSEVPDTLLWRWTTDAQYSSKSCYDFLFEGAITSSSWRLDWRAWAPPRVKFFVWLACQNRCWTADRLARRGLQHPPRCPLCDQSDETMRQLLVACPFSRSIWHEVLSWVRPTATPPDVEDDFVEWWLKVSQSTTEPCARILRRW